MIRITKLTQEQVDALRKTIKERVELSPAQKFALIKREYDSKKFKLKRWHFIGIEHGIRIYLFNGLGKELAVFDNSFHGKRECRVFAVDLFTEETTKKGNINGGYRFDFV